MFLRPTRKLRRKDKEEEEEEEKEKEKKNKNKKKLKLKLSEIFFVFSLKFCLWRNIDGFALALWFILLTLY